jgi:hypothetical protein
MGRQCQASSSRRPPWARTWPADRPRKPGESRADRAQKCKKELLGNLFSGSLDWPARDGVMLALSLSNRDLVTMPAQLGVWAWLESVLIL